MAAMVTATMKTDGLTVVSLRYALLARKPREVKRFLMPLIVSIPLLALPVCQSMDFFS
jgi:hypothetical protein